MVFFFPLFIDYFPIFAGETLAIGRICLGSTHDFLEQHRIFVDTFPFQVKYPNWCWLNSPRNPSFFRRKAGHQGKPGDSAGPGQYDAHKAGMGQKPTLL